jgi:hypothetical protein
MLIDIRRTCVPAINRSCIAPQGFDISQQRTVGRAVRTEKSPSGDKTLVSPHPRPHASGWENIDASNSHFEWPDCHSGPRR